MTNILAIFSLVFMFSWSVSAAQSGEAQFQVLTQPLTLQEGQIKSARLTMTLPKNFHAYADQFKVSNVQPNTFQVGQLKLKPEIEFYDKYSKKNRKGLFETGEIELQIESPEKVTSKMEKLMFDIKYQICSEQVCFLPKTQTITIDVNFAQMKEATAQPSMTMFSAGTIENQLSKNFYLTFLLVFLAGILTSFTPCIFPMIPITLSILGHDSHEKSRTQNILRSIFYVLGIAVTYSSLGVLAALTGAIFGQALANKWVVLSMVGLFVLMALSMWGAFELQVPAFIRNRFGTGKSHGFVGAFFMGMVAGIVASPCVGPVLVSILSFVSTTQNAVLGFTLLFTYAIGLGLIFIAIGASSQLLKKLPRSGPWMEFIKFSLGLLMVCVALYYLKFVIPMEYWIMILGVTFMAISIWQGAYHFQRKHPYRQGLFIIVFVASFTLTLLSVLKREYVSPIFNNQPEDVTELLIKWTPYSESVIAQAKTENQPVILDFFAEWCAACHELEEKTYTNPEFIELSKQFKLVKIDATEDTPAVKQILEKYKIKGLPTVVFINNKGDILSELTFTQFLDWKDLKPKMVKALE
ncbi:MAG: cytochrome c biogenesis protein CcdA [Bdellovibrionota bacterium]